MSAELDLSLKMKMKFIHHIIRDHGLEISHDDIEKKPLNFDEAVKRMNKWFAQKLK